MMLNNIYILIIYSAIFCVVFILFLVIIINIFIKPVSTLITNNTLKTAKFSSLLNYLQCLRIFLYRSFILYNAFIFCILYCIHTYIFNVSIKSIRIIYIFVTLYIIIENIFLQIGAFKNALSTISMYNFDIFLAQFCLYFCISIGMIFGYIIALNVYCINSAIIIKTIKNIIYVILTDIIYNQFIHKYILIFGIFILPIFIALFTTRYLSRYNK